MQLYDYETSFNLAKNSEIPQSLYISQDAPVFSLFLETPVAQPQKERRKG